MSDSIWVSIIGSGALIVVAILEMGRRTNKKVDETRAIAEEARDFSAPTGNGFADGVTHMLAKLEFELRLNREMQDRIMKEVQHLRDTGNRRDAVYLREIAQLKSKDEEVSLLINTICENIRKEGETDGC